MEFKISDSLKKLIKQYFFIDFDEFKIKKINHYNQSYKFIFTNNISYIKIVFNEKYILLIDFLKIYVHFIIDFFTIVIKL